MLDGPITDPLLWAGGKLVYTGAQAHTPHTHTHTFLISSCILFYFINKCFAAELIMLHDKKNMQNSHIEMASN